MFAIVGAAGKIGYATSVKLREAGVQVRAILRDAEKAPPLREIGCEIALADLRLPENLGRAIASAGAVQIILPPPTQAQDAVGEMRLMIDSLAEAITMARPKLVLAISDYGAHVGGEIGMPSMFHMLEERLRQVNVPKIFLRSAEHMEGWGAFIPLAAATGTLPSLHHPVTRSFPTVSARDVGLIAADLLLRSEIAVNERIVHAEGPRRYSASDVAAAMSELLGCTVVAQPLPRERWRENLERALSPSAATMLVNLYNAHNEGGLVDVEQGGQVRRGSTALIDALRSRAPGDAN